METDLNFAARVLYRWSPYYPQATDSSMTMATVGLHPLKSYAGGKMLAISGEEVREHPMEYLYIIAQ